MDNQYLNGISLVKQESGEVNYDSPSYPSLQVERDGYAVDFNVEGA